MKLGFLDSNDAKVQFTKLGEMGKGGIVNRNEPEGPNRAITHDKGWFQIVGWFNFLHKFSGYDYGVVVAFMDSFDGYQVKLSNPMFEIS